MSVYTRSAILICAALIVSLGLPGTVWGLGPVAAVCGFALAWGALLDLSSDRRRAAIAALWFAAVSAIQTSWLLSHQFLYIYGAWLLFASLVGLQFGVVSLLLSRRFLSQWWLAPCVAAGWVLMEWGRLFFFSGYTWYPVGLSLASTSYGLQLASLFGVYGMSALVIAVNVLVLQAWQQSKRSYTIAALVLAFFSYAYGGIQLQLVQQDEERSIAALLVQPNFSVDHGSPGAPRERVNAALGRWAEILQLIASQDQENLDLVVLPEYVVELSSYWPAYRLQSVQALFVSAFGPEVLFLLPELRDPLATQIDTYRGTEWFVSNAYISQALADMLSAGVVIGLGDEDTDGDKDRNTYIAAQYFQPKCTEACRYEKRVLLPMGEYIPGEWCRKIAEGYGVYGSFTPGQSARCLHCGDVPFGVCICYEETFGDLMRENRLKGAEMLVNVTNDGWYPHSSLPREHLEHARLRTVELGIPLLRAANTGITGAIDSRGVDIALLGHDEKGALRVDLPIQPYRTLYALFGDGPIVGLALLTLFLSWRLPRRV